MTLRLTLAVGVLALGLVSARSTPVGAQGAATDMLSSGCDLDVSPNRDLEKVEILLVVAVNARSDSGRRVALRSAGQLLTDLDTPGARGDKSRAWQLGRALVLWLDIVGQPVLTTRGALGFVGDSAAPVDLSVWIDSTFSAVEAVVPSCVDDATTWRQHPGWVRLVHRAMDHANAGQIDSAQASVMEADRIYAKNPYTAFVMGEVARAHHDPRTAVVRFWDAIDLSLQDSSFISVRRSAEAAIGEIALPAARNAGDSVEKAFFLETATHAFQRMRAETGGAAAGQSGLTAAAALSGDSAAAARTYDAVMRDDGSTYADIVAAGLIAGTARQLPQAMALFRRAVALNPYHRDALSDLATLLVAADSAPAARPLVDRLLAVDPANRAGYLLAAQVYTAMARAAKSADSAVSFNRMALSLLATRDSLTFTVEFRDWAVHQGAVTLSGAVASKAPAPRDLVLHVEFLDATGRVVAASDAPVSTNPGHPSMFSVVGKASGIVAFRYAPPS